MSILVSLQHTTRYAYDRPVMLGPQIVRLRPAPHCRTAVPSYSLKVTPAQHFVNWQQDPMGNWLARYVFPERTREFAIAVDLIADMSVINPFDFFIEPMATEFPFAYAGEFSEELAPYLIKEPAGPRLTAFLASVSRVKQNTTDFLVALNQRLQHEVRYVVRMEPGVQSTEETLTLASGSCRDTAWLLVQILRHIGLAARFVSGYLIQIKPDLKSLDGPSGAAHDFTDLHAWAEVYLPGAGWIGLDPTSGLLTGEGHLPLAATPHYRAAAPISGGVEAAKVEFAFDMKLTRIDEKPRVTFPFSDDAWIALDALGEKIDADLAGNDVRLTMGGEPTFVSVDDYQAAEWNTDALGPTKRILADRLIRRLRDRFAPGGMLHYGQGKWYPGEPLPRWAFSLFWRKDGKPVWQNADLLASPEADAAADERRGAPVHRKPGGAARHHARACAAGLRRSGRAHAQGRRAAGQYRPEQSRDRRSGRARPHHGRVQPPRSPCPPAMCCRCSAGRRRRVAAGCSEVWKFRRKHLFLMPGDSPLGLRLPLASLPKLPPADEPFLVPADPFAERGVLPDPQVLARSFAVAGNGHVPPASRAARSGQAQDAKVPVRTAMAVEPRDGQLCVFMPPVERLDDYIELLAAVEATAAEQGLPIHVEGYLPPHDPRLNVIKVTPDPGVIEVNVHPVGSWREAVGVTQTLYEEARLTRLGADKFLIDGRHTGTGGGNHVVLGGESAADSPFLRRPDLLKSFVLYFQRHPSLSYLFSGLFIGPTSQAPRIDEARHDLLYETGHRRCAWCRRPAGASRRGRGWSTGCSAISWSTSPAIPTAPKSASTNCSRPTGRPAGSAWSNSAPSKCRPTRA